MTFSPVNYSQQDPQWKAVKIGASGETIGHVGCALTSVAMLVSGHGYPETPKSLNAKLKAKGGFVDASIIWGAITSIYPQVVYKTLALCRDTAAPLAQIDASLAAGQPVVVEVDSSPKAGLQTHWVTLYARQGDDYLMLDPWPHPTESGQEVLLTPRYSHGKPLKKTITAVVFYECKQGGSGTETTTTDETPSEAGTYVHIPVTVEAGLRLRTQPTVASDTLAIQPPGADLRIVEPLEVALPKIGVYDQWIRVRDRQGREGYVAAWYVEQGPVVAGPSTPGTSAGATPPPITEASPRESEAAPVPEPKPEELVVYVSQAVGASGLRIRKTASKGGALVAVAKAGAALTALEKPQKAKPKIGAAGKWLHVANAKRQRGYVAAEFVTAEPGAPVSFEVTAAEELTVYVSNLAAAGLWLRGAPAMDAATLKVLPASAALTVLEGTVESIGVYGQWLKVRDAQGAEGYVAAWFVRT
ncbi:MAG: C39 family peptidase [Chloroflexota bacterium]